MEVWVAIAHLYDDPEERFVQLGTTSQAASAALDRLIAHMYEQLCDGMDAKDCGTLEDFRNRFAFEAPEEFTVHER